MKLCFDRTLEGSTSEDVLKVIDNDLEQFAEEFAIELVGEESSQQIKEFLTDKKYQLPQKLIRSIVNIITTKELDQDLFKLLRSIYWILQSGLLSSHKNIVVACINACKRTSDLNCLYHAMRILDNYEDSKTKPNLAKIVLDYGGLVIFTEALERSRYTIDDKTQMDFIFKTLNYWFIWTQSKLVCPLRQRDVSKMTNYYTDLLLNEDINEKYIDFQNYIRNIITYFLNLQSNLAQKQYICKLVQLLVEQTSGTASILKFIKKLSTRGRAAMIRNAHNKAVLSSLKTIVLIPGQKKDVLDNALDMIVLLYTAPQYLLEQRMFKSDDFLSFLILNINNYDGRCSRILRFLILNDAQNEDIKQKILLSSGDFNGIFDDFKHKCHVFEFTSIVFFSISIWFDSLQDIIVSLIDLAIGKQQPIAGILLFFSILSLPMCSILSLHNFYSTGPLSLVFSLEDHIPAHNFLSYLFPWRFDRIQHILFNFLTVVQFHPILTGIDYLYHIQQPLGNIHQANYNLAKLKITECLLENIPCLVIKIVLVYKALQDDMFQWNLPNIAIIISIVWSIVSLSKSSLDFEKKSRVIDLGDNQIKLLSQKLAIFVGYMTMVSSRILVLLLLFSITQSNIWKLILILSIHIIVTFFIHLSTFTKIRSDKEIFVEPHYVFLRNFPRNFPLFLLSFAFSEVFLVLLRNPAEIFGGSYPYYHYRRTPRAFFLVFTFHAAEVITVVSVVLSSRDSVPTFIVILGCTAVGLYLISGVSFFVYMKVLDDDDDENEENARNNWRNRSCLRNEPKSGLKPRAFRFIRSQTRLNYVRVMNVIGRSYAE